MITAVILGAGESTRMGEPKLLLPYGTRTVIEHIVEELSGGEVQEILVVLGHDPAPVRRALEGRDVRIVENPDYAQGMLSSVRCGLRALPRGTEGVLIVLGDQPSIQSDVVEGMIYAFRGTEKGIVVPTYRGRRGHPLLFSARYCEEVLSEFDETGLRGLLQAHSRDVFEFPVDSEDILHDMDTPEDYRREIDRREGASEA
jgi:molybdenum cofactor cytidylyltransferase